MNNLSFCTPKFFMPKSYLIKISLILVKFTDNTKNISKLNFLNFYQNLTIFIEYDFWPNLKRWGKLCDLRFSRCRGLYRGRRWPLLNGYFDETSKVPTIVFNMTSASLPKCTKLRGRPSYVLTWLFQVKKFHIVKLLSYQLSFYCKFFQVPNYYQYILIYFFYHKKYLQDL